MLKYLVILLDDTSVAYCHAENKIKKRKLMTIDTLEKAILWGMKHNLMIQYVFPDYPLPELYIDVINSIDNVKIYPCGHKPIVGMTEGKDTDIVISETVSNELSGQNVVLRLPFCSLKENRKQITDLFSTNTRINICITDVDRFSDNNINEYKQLLEDWSNYILRMYQQGNAPQINLLTDRIFLDKMRNCDAGVNSITISPDGKFYICPAFYYDEVMEVDNMMKHGCRESDYSVGDIENGLMIPNKQLLNLDHAPLCKKCDAFQCRRCVWLNYKLTWDCNTPSHQQCVMAHLERNASRALLINLQKVGVIKQDSIVIKEIQYLDPFDLIRR